MKKTISAVYPPPQAVQKQQQHMQKKTHKLNRCQRGSLAGRQPPPPPHTHTHTNSHTHTLPPRLPFFRFCNAIYKTFEWHFAGGPMVARHCVLAGIGFVHVLFRHLVALH